MHDPISARGAPDGTLDAAQYQSLTGEPLATTLDLQSWSTGVRALASFERLEREVAQAERSESALRQTIREKIFPALAGGEGAPREAGVYRATLADLREAQEDVLFNGQVEACDANSHVLHLLPMQIIQIAVTAVTYHGAEETWSHRLYCKEIALTGGASLIDETLEVLRRRSGRAEGGGRRRVTDRMRRAVMTYMERAVLADASRAKWRMGHGNPLAFEVMMGSGMPELIELGVPVIERLVSGHKRFVFVPSETTKEHVLTVGDALEPLEYAVVDDAREDLRRLLDGHFQGDRYRDPFENVLKPFCERIGPEVLMGVYRVSPLAPARVFYAHREHVHEAALIAMADSMMQEHRGFPMLIDMADRMCATYFGAETLSRPAQVALAGEGQAWRYLDERATRNHKGGER